MAASDRVPAFTRVLYAVNTTGDVWFNPTIKSSDSPDYSTGTGKSEGVTQSALLSPQGEEVVPS